MQDRYVGDVGDFGKYALLRCITSERSARLGVVWCSYPNESHNLDGRHIGYLDRGEFFELDPELHAALGMLVRKGLRSIAAVETAKLLPSDTLFFRDPIAGTLGRGSAPEQRIAYRMDWLERALSS